MISRAVRFIRYHARDYNIDPNHLCICGGSAGGHLSLMQAYDPIPPDLKSADPIDHESAGVFAVAVFFPPADFLYYGQPGEIAWKKKLAWLLPPFDFQETDPKTKQFILITDEAKREEIGRAISPITYVHPGVPATLLIHGDADALVPYQQSQILLAKLKDAKVEARLVTKPGKNHGWPNIQADVATMADFFAAQTAATSTKPTTNPSQP
jgi:acetyl esterase/lipase